MGATIRDPIVSGTFYPGTRDALSAMLSTLLGDEVDRRCAPFDTPVCLIAPHAGYPYSGPTAAAAYRLAAAAGRPSLVVLLGANHTGFGHTTSVGDHDAWRTPLGDVPIAREVVETLERGGLPVERDPFAGEHSIEVQLPFVQHLWGSTVPIVPICVQFGTPDVIVEHARAIVAALQGRDDVLFVASSDFTHYEPDATARSLDRGAIEWILRLDAPGFLQHCIDERLTICGAGAIAMLMAIAGELDLIETALIDYSTSGDTAGDRSAVVGYAAVSFLRRDHG